MTWPTDAALKHGFARRSGRVPEYNVWGKMIARCNNAKTADYKNYGGRGIKVCDRWQESFKNFYADMGPRPNGYQIERKNNNGDYEPGNCIWATRKMQANNRRARIRPSNCKQGHSLLGPNAYVRPDGKRGCRVCRKDNMKDYYDRKRMAA